jgi:dTDP-glucose 4,6-dehydratase
MTPKSLIITGGAGFIGSHLVHLAVARGHRVLNVDKLTYAGNLASLDDLTDHPLHEFLHADICDAAAMRHAFECFRPDAILHLAAESHVDRSIAGPAPFIETNVGGTVTLLEAATGHHRSLPSAARDAFRFIHVSTDEVYGSLGPGDPPFSESSPYRPRSPYAASKAASDHLARAWHETHGLPVVVTHSSNNYGPRQHPEKLIPTVILNAIHDRSIPIYGTGENIRDWLFVEDHTHALLAVLESGAPGETYDIGANHELRNIDLARQICRTLDDLRPHPNGRPHTDLITFVDDRPGHDFRYALDSAKARTQLGWSSTAHPSAALAETIRWYLENQPWWQPARPMPAGTVGTRAQRFDP